MAKAIYAGTFDPVSYGHLDIVERACAVFDELVVATTEPVNKQPLFSLKERVELLQQTVNGGREIKVLTFNGLLVEFARKIGAQVLVRGLRAASDFEYEFEMAMMNRKLAPDVETVFLVTRPDYMYVSSSLIKEIAKGGGDISHFVPPAVRSAIITKLGQP